MKHKQISIHLHDPLVINQLYEQLRGQLYNQLFWSLQGRLGGQLYWRLGSQVRSQALVGIQNET